MNVLFTRSAFEDLDRLAEETGSRVLAAIERFADVYPQVRLQALTGVPGMFRLRVGDYRVIFSIEDAQQSMVVRVIGHRRDIYRDLD